MKDNTKTKSLPLPRMTCSLYSIIRTPKFDYPVHYHPDYEINLVMDTYGSRIVGDSVEAFEALDLIMIGPNLPHAWKGEVVEGNHVITIQFSDKLLNFPILGKTLIQPHQATAA